MPFTFNDDLSTTRDKVRARIGDIDSSNVLMQDATVDAYISEHTSVVRASIACVRFILGALARSMTRNVLGISGSIAEATANYQIMLTDLEREAAMDTGIESPSLSIASVHALNTANGVSKAPPRFQSGMFDNDQDASAYDSPDWGSNGG